jgi:hypothetical protein
LPNRVPNNLEWLSTVCGATEQQVVIGKGEHWEKKKRHGEVWDMDTCSRGELKDERE